MGHPIESTVLIEPADASELIVSAEISEPIEPAEAVLFVPAGKPTSGEGWRLPDSRFKRPVYPGRRIM